MANSSPGIYPLHYAEQTSAEKGRNAKQEKHRRDIVKSNIVNKTGHAPISTPGKIEENGRFTYARF